MIPIKYASRMRRNLRLAMNKLIMGIVNFKRFISLNVGSRFLSNSTRTFGSDKITKPLSIIWQIKLYKYGETSSIEVYMKRCFVSKL